MIAIALAAAVAAWQVAHREALFGTEEQISRNLVLTRRAIESEIERVGHLPPVPGENRRVGRAIAERFAPGIEPSRRPHLRASRFGRGASCQHPLLDLPSDKKTRRDSDYNLKQGEHIWQETSLPAHWRP